MSHTLRIVYVCDNCGEATEMSVLKEPEGWRVSVPSASYASSIVFGIYGEQDRCPSCIKAVKEAEAQALAGRRDVARIGS